MTLLFVSYSQSFYHGSTSNNIKLKYFLIGPREVPIIETGSDTYAGRALWKLFVNGKIIQCGVPEEFRVKISKREASIFKKIVKAGFHRKISIWKEMLTKGIPPPVMLEKLEKVLPIWILRKQLEK